MSCGASPNVPSNEGLCALSRVPPATVRGGKAVPARVQQQMLARIAQPPPWLPDQLAPSCQLCALAFSASNRRHHCRHCGRIACGDCSSHKSAIPKFGVSKPTRVCSDCAPVLRGRAGAAPVIGSPWSRPIDTSGMAAHLDQQLAATTRDAPPPPATPERPAATAAAASGGGAAASPARFASPSPATTPLPASDPWASAEIGGDRDPWAPGSGADPWATPPPRAAPDRAGAPDSAREVSRDFDEVANPWAATREEGTAPPPPDAPRPAAPSAAAEAASNPFGAGAPREAAPSSAAPSPLPLTPAAAAAASANPFGERTDDAEDLNPFAPPLAERGPSALPPPHPPAWCLPRPRPPPRTPERRSALPAACKLTVAPGLAPGRPKAETCPSSKTQAQADSPTVRTTLAHLSDEAFRSPEE